MDMIDPVKNSFDALMNLGTKASDLLMEGKLPHVQDGLFEKKHDTDVATLIFYLRDYASVKLTVDDNTPVGYAIVDIKYPQRRKADESKGDDIWKTSIDFSAKDTVDPTFYSYDPELLRAYFKRSAIPSLPTAFETSITVTPPPLTPEQLERIRQHGATGGGAGSIQINYVLPPVPCPLESIWMILDAVANGQRINERTWQIDNEYENEEY